MCSAANRYRRFPIYSSPAALLTTAWLQLPALILAAFYGPQVAGWFALGQLVLGAPVALLGDSVGQVYLAEATRLAREPPGALYRLFVSTAVRLFLLGAIPVILIALGGPDLFKFVFGPSWGETGLYVQLLAPMFVLRFVVAPISQTLSVVLERQDLLLVLSMVRIAVNIGTLLVAGWLHVAPPIAVALYSASMVLIYVGHFLLIVHALRKHANGGMQSR